MPQNAANRDSFPFTVQGSVYPTVGPALKFFLTGNGKIEAKVTGGSARQFNPPQVSNNISIKFQDSNDDGILDPWADIDPDATPGTPDIVVVPLGEAFAHISVHKPYLRVIGYGNSDGMLDLSWNGLDGLQLMEF